MPCLNGRFPVAMEVHSIGESGGCRVAICPVAPFSTRRWTLGILPGVHERTDDLPVGGIPPDQENLTWSHLTYPVKHYRSGVVRRKCGVANRGRSRL